MPRVSKRFALFITLLVLLGLSIFSPVALTATTTVAVDPSSIVDTNLGPGSSFYVNITVADVTKLYGWEFQLNYTTSVLTCNSVTEGAFLKQGPAGRRLWVSTDTGDTIYKLYHFNVSETQTSWAAGTDKPYGIEYYNGQMYYVDPGTDLLYNQTDETGAAGSPASWNIAGFAGDAYGLGFNGTHFAIADHGDRKVYITAFSAPATKLAEFTGFTRPHGVTWGDGYWWVTDVQDDDVDKVSTTGSIVTSYDIGTYSGDGEGITYDGSNFWICDSGDDKIYKTDTSFTLVATYTSPATVPHGLSYAQLDASKQPPYVIENSDANGRVWVADTLLGDVPGSNGGGVLATLGFSVDARGNTSLDLHDTYLVGYNYSTNKATFYITHTLTDGYFDNRTEVPEFPFGAAMEIALIVIIAYVWWRNKTKIRPQTLHK